MSNLSYVMLSKQAALSREMDNIANNISNANTTGFRRDADIFTEYVNAIRGEPSISQTRIGAHSINMKQGEMNKTGGDFDLAIEGRGFFGVITPNGLRLTRAGAFLLNDGGVLTTTAGHPVAGDGASPITIPTDAKNLTISVDGGVAADGNVIGKITLLDAPEISLVREGETLFKAMVETQPVESGRIRQGYLEASNVDAVQELSRMIEVQRAFELEQQIVNDDARRVQQAIETLSGLR